MDADAVLGEGGRQVVLPKRVFGRDHLMRDALNGVERLGRTQPVRAHVARLALDLLLDPRDANFEKLVQVRADNREELDALDQRLGRILGLFEDAPIKFEPAQLAIDEIFRRGKTRSRVPLRRLWQRDNVRRLFWRRGLRFWTHRSQPGAR